MEDRKWKTDVNTIISIRDIHYNVGKKDFDTEVDKEVRFKEGLDYLEANYDKGLMHLINELAKLSIKHPEFNCPELIKGLANRLT